MSSTSHLFSPCAADLFTYAGQEAGLELWHATPQFRLAPLDLSDYSKPFHPLNALLILHTLQKESSATNIAHLKSTLYCWYGAQCPADSRLVVALHAEALHRHLSSQTQAGASGGTGRVELEGQESDDLKRVFATRGGFKQAKKGQQTSLKHWQPLPHVVVLFQLLPHAASPQMPLQVVKPHFDSLCASPSDIFVLETLDAVFVWLPNTAALSDIKRRAFALQFTARLSSQKQRTRHSTGRSRSIEVQIIGGWERDSLHRNREFWTALGVESDAKALPAALVASLESKLAAPLAIHSPNADCILDLYEIAPPQEDDATVQPSVSVIEARPLTRDMLDSSCVYLIDCDSLLLAWIGAESDDECRSVARQMLHHDDTQESKELQRPAWTRRCQVIEEAGIECEDILFNCLIPQSKLECVESLVVDTFDDLWGSKPMPAIDHAQALKVLSSPVESAVQAQAAADAIAAASVSPINDDATFSGDISLFVISHHSLVPLPISHLGHFLDRATYVLVYSWQSKQQQAQQEASGNAMQSYVVYVLRTPNSLAADWLTWHQDLAPDLCDALHDLTGKQPLVRIIDLHACHDHHLLSLLKHSYVTYDSGSVLLDRTQHSHSYTVQHQSFDIGQMQSTKPKVVTLQPTPTKAASPAAQSLAGDLIADYAPDSALDDGYHDRHWQQRSNLHRHFDSSQHLLFHCRLAAVQPLELIESVLKQAEQQQAAAQEQVDNSASDAENDENDEPLHVDASDTVVALRALSKLQLHHSMSQSGPLPRLFVLRDNAHLMQLSALSNASLADRLSPHHCYLVQSRTASCMHLHVWRGAACSLDCPDEDAVQRAIDTLSSIHKQRNAALPEDSANKVTISIERHAQGTESDLFWTGIGASTAAERSRLQSKFKPTQPRSSPICLYVFSIASHSLHCTPLSTPFTMSALSQSRVYVLDLNDSSSPIFMWRDASQSSAQHAQLCDSVNACLAQIVQAGNRRIAQLHRGREPPAFTALFHDWREGQFESSREHDWLEPGWRRQVMIDQGIVGRCVARNQTQSRLSSLAAKFSSA